MQDPARPAPPGIPAGARSRRGRASFRSVPSSPVRVLGPLVAAGALAVPAAAQGPAPLPTLLVSTSQGVGATTKHEAVDDSTLVRVRAGADPYLHLAEGHWLGVAGRVPGDVDALAFMPGVDPALHRAIVFSMQSDEGGFDDGDVLFLTPGGGFDALFLETDLMAALGVTGSGFDVDAVAFDDAGRLLFSVQSDVDSTQLGPVEDGDVLRLESDGSVSRPFLEADVQAAFGAATGLSSSVNDVFGLEVHGGEVWATVQSPSSTDGAVLALGAAARIVYDESEIGLGGAELDALAVLDPAAESTRLFFSAHAAAPGDQVVAGLDGGVGGQPYLVLISGNAGYASTESFLDGFGGLFVDANDPFLNMFVVPVVVNLDGSGAFSQALQLPPGNFGGSGFEGEPGWTFQVVDVATFEVSMPWRIEL